MTTFLIVVGIVVTIVLGVLALIGSRPETTNAPKMSATNPIAPTITAPSGASPPADRRS
jgi:hypothetical protein